MISIYAQIQLPSRLGERETITYERVKLTESKSVKAARNYIMGLATAAQCLHSEKYTEPPAIESVQIQEPHNTKTKCPFVDEWKRSKCPFTRRDHKTCPNEGQVFPCLYAGISR